ncbi:MAG TPA: ABC transporter permease [Vicinamibacterales bacterium]|nr:ABC transporter permease [Vicinamibacterales bacterium]
MWSNDFLYAARLLSSTPAFSLVALLTLSLGVGANAAIFSIVDHVLLRRAPIPDIDRLAVVWETDRDTGTTHEPASLPDYLDFRQRARQVDELGAFGGRSVNFAPEHGEPARLQALEVTHELLPMLGAEPIAGRTFTADETRRGGPAVVVISDGLWHRAFGGDPSILGRTVSLDDRPFEVIGILARGSDFGVFQILTAADYSRSFADRGARAAVDLWLPLQEDEESMPRSTHPIFMVARTRSTLAAAQEELAAIAADLERAYPVNAARGVSVEPLSAIVFGPIRPALLVLLAAVSLVLLVACANVANLLLARGTARQREVAIRIALGAGPWRLIRQFVADGLLLAACAAALGSAIAVAGVKALVKLAPVGIPRIADAAVDLRVLGVMLLVSAAAGVVFGLAPALQARRVDVQGTLKTDGGHGGSAGRERTRIRSMLVAAEFALAMMLVIGASLLIKSFWRLMQVDPGFRSAGILKAEYQLPSSRYPVDFARWPDFKEMHAFSAGLLEHARRLPGVVDAAIAGNHPMDPGFTNSFSVVGREAEGRNWPEISVRRVTDGYFRTMGVPLVRGRALASSDGTTAPPVVVINEAAARRFFENHEPLGRQMEFWGARRTIVGIVGNERFHGIAEAPPPAVYAPLSQAPSANGSGALLVRTSGDPAALAGSVRGAIARQDPALAVFGLEPLDDTLAQAVGERRFTMLVLGLLAAIALVLAAIGVHGVLSCAVTQRTHEIGIRMALGAQPSRVLRLVVFDGLTLAAAGGAIGLAAAWALTRGLASLLFGVSATDPLTFIAVPVGLSVVAFAASYVPARRATRVDPVTALRE